jgi:hypothetical protein
MDDSTQIAGVEPELLSHVVAVCRRVVVELVENADFGERVGTLEKSLVEDADLFGVEVG